MQPKPRQPERTMSRTGTPVASTSPRLPFGPVREFVLFIGRGGIAGLPALLRQAPEVLQHVPPESRKGRFRMLSEHLAWLARHRELCSQYYKYNLHRSDRDGPERYMPYRQFRKLRARANRRCAGHDYPAVVQVLQDKVRFSEFLDENGIVGPRRVAVVEEGTVGFWTGTGWRSGTLDELRAMSMEVFCKPAGGIQSQGAFRLRVEGGQALVNGSPVDQTGFGALFPVRYLVQERVEQHPWYRALHPDSLNTFRIITMRTPSGCVEFLSFLRVGSGGSVVDNHRYGGLVCLVLDRDGCLGPGILPPRLGSETVDCHPDTGMPLAGQVAPHYEEARELAIRLHEMLPLHSVGWDIAIGPEGPLPVEGNDDWGAATPMMLDPSFRDRFLAFHDH
jgi:hypothetical protein